MQQTFAPSSNEPLTQPLQLSFVFYGIRLLSSLICSSSFKAGEVVLQEGDTGNSFYIVKSGLPFKFVLEVNLMVILAFCLPSRVFKSFFALIRMIQGPSIAPKRLFEFNFSRVQCSLRSVIHK